MQPQIRTAATLASSGEFVDQLEAMALAHRAVRHPYLEALASGDLPDIQGAIKDFAHQYLAYSANFARYLTATMTQLDSLDHRRALVDNLAEESGHLHAEDLEALAAIGVEEEWVQGIPHPLLFRRFLAALGMDEAWLAENPHCDEAVIWSKLFLEVCGKGGAAQAVGAMGLGTEAIVSTMYKPILECLRKFSTVSRFDRVFFDLHTEVDDEHALILHHIARDLADDPTQRAGLYQGTKMALVLREAFFDTMHRRALAMPRVDA